MVCAPLFRDDAEDNGIGRGAGLVMTVLRILSVGAISIDFLASASVISSKCDRFSGSTPSGMHVDRKEEEEDLDDLEEESSGGESGAWSRAVEWSNCDMAIVMAGTSGREAQSLQVRCERTVSDARDNN